MAPLPPALVDPRRKEQQNGHQAIDDGDNRSQMEDGANHGQNNRDDDEKSEQ